MKKVNNDQSAYFLEHLRIQLEQKYGEDQLYKGGLKIYTTMSAQMQRAAYESVGNLDERFGTGCFEDFDYCLRLRQAGWTLKAAKDVFVWHRHHASFAGYDHFHACAVKNREVFVDKWCRKALSFLDELDPLLETDAAALKAGR